MADLFFNDPWVAVQNERIAAQQATAIAAAITSSVAIFRDAVDRFAPTHIVSMVSGGYDSAASDQIAREIGAKIDFVMHGNTRCGIRETTDFVRACYGQLGDYVEADAGTAYEDYVLRKGFFGKGNAAHRFSYRLLKATPFRKAISSHIRQGRRGIRVLFLNGARKDESDNRQQHLQVTRRDPAAPGNIWVNLIHHWSQETRDAYLRSRGTAINPVATQLCRSGECMCGTMQTPQERMEAASLYPKWGHWLDGLEREARRLHGFGWGEGFPKPVDSRQIDLFQPMCSDCVRRPA
ncbi:phosphoadenosine phosphosulfate reductase domain-containing protein [Sphingomonas sp. Leaf4]|uniref:phosphoadenosine phosphosulfate reductase domain-containing protein n=1 Tax=Sphingomonas sp. Leaf4 TaxID=2876553 RepID=UPI001E59EBC6|nr:phosphoadenosine phosphosulfate reductase family protein [Sphingomonas sp. Leaf4]